MSPRIGIIGLGEAGSAIAAGLLEEHGIHVIGYDARGDDPVVASRASRAGVTVVDSIAALAAASDVVISLTSAKVATAVAESAAAHLGSGHVFSDWNSSSPELKRRVAEIITASGAAFADGAVMAAVPPQRHRVPVLLSGDGAARFADALRDTSMRLDVIGDEPGQASAVKMFRSLLVKGLEALLLEFGIGATAYGVAGPVLASMNGSLPMDDWHKLAAYLFARTVEHGERRAEELRQVADTLTEAGIEPLLARAGADRLQWLVDNRASLPPGASYEDALDALIAGRGEEDSQGGDASLGGSGD